MRATHQAALAARLFVTNEEETTMRGMSWSRRAMLGGLGVAAVGVLSPLGSAAVGAQAATPTAASQVPADFKVVLHASDPNHWPYVLSNLDNLTQEWPQAQIRVVVDGTAVYALQNSSDVATKLGKSAAAGVAVAICPNALHEHGVDPKTMPSYATMTLGGVVSLVAAQREGFAYVKP